MKNNLPTKEDNSFLKKIKNFFRKLFYRKPVEKSVDNVIAEQTLIKKENNTAFQESIKVEVKNDYLTEMKREKFLDDLEKNPKLLYELPIEKLEKLEDYYKISIKKQEEKLARIKKLVKRL